MQGIVFSSVIVRVVSRGDSHHTERTIPSKRNRWSIRPPNGEQIYSTSTPGGAVQVSLQQTTHTYIGGFPGDVGNDLSSAHTQLKYNPFPAV
ncbi:hypothetical protein M405DRAFT_861120 [Rhizopogon salebrosus TDB-379]|nr:hypothetical protein M405DRAFT_861120 [Rhizopogon salebrosus TDB-379]